jgi:hypothetical protein
MTNLKQSIFIRSFVTLRSWPFSQLTRERKQRRVTCRTLGLCSEPAWLTYVQIPNATEKSSRPWPGWPTGRVPERRPCSARPRQSPGTGNPSSEGEAIAAGLGSEPGAGAAVPVHWLHPAAAVRRASPVALPPTVSLALDGSGCHAFLTSVRVSPAWCLLRAYVPPASAADRFLGSRAPYRSRPTIYLSPRCSSMIEVWLNRAASN